MEITDITFSAEYKPQINHIIRAQTSNEIGNDDICSFNGCMYETYGDEYEYVQDVAESTPNHVWSIIEVESGEMRYFAGFRDDAFGYLITEKEWTDIDTEVYDECYDEKDFD